MTTYKEGDPLGTTKLIIAVDDEQTLTIDREADAADAVTRGLAEYFHSLESTIDGTAVRFKQVFSVWATPEDIATYPSAVVLKEGEVTYGDSSFTPQISQTEVKGVARSYLVSPCEIEMVVGVEIWTTDERERARIMAMIEDAIFPVEFMYGFRLELPFYFNARASFEPIGATFEDNPENAKTRQRKVTQRFNVTMPVYRLITDIPKAKGRVRLSLTTTTGALEQSS